MLNQNNNQDEDVEAEADAAEARRRGTEVIEGHLSHHIQQNPDSSYVTWIACLHPENAEVTIDERFLIPGNPWWTVYEGAKADIPTATATPLAEEAPAVVPSTSTAVATPNSNLNPFTTAPEDVSKQATGIDLLVGCILSIVAILAVFGMETVGFCVYWISTGFYHLAQALDPPSAITGIFYSLCLLVYYTLALIDSCLLIASVLTTEIVAFTLLLLSSLLAGCDMAKRWHQYLRRTCHLLRWAFRSESLSADPPRHLCLVCLPKKDLPEDDEDEKEDTAVAAAATEEGRAQWVEPAATTTVPAGKEHWLEVETSATPTAPPSEEDVILLDESNVFVDHGNGSSNKKEDSWSP
jgi:hypothetical protein